MAIWDIIFGNKEKQKFLEKELPNSNENIDSNITTNYSIRYYLDLKNSSNEGNIFKSPCCDSRPCLEKLNCKNYYESNCFLKRADIEKLSLEFGYSVFDNPGGTENCKCFWNSKLVVEKNTPE